MSDQDWYDRLIRPIERQMKSSVWRILRDADDAEDAIQEAVTRVWTRIDRVERHSNPHALILRICANAAWDILRRKSRRRHVDLDSLPVEPAAATPLPGDALLRRERQAQLLRAIGRLARRQACATLMRFVQEQSYEAIAAAMGCRESTVRVHVNRGRARLQKLLAPFNPFRNSQRSSPTVRQGKEVLDHEEA
jgi:RNA polymerase sigma-70 factor (ECF subfamily)